MSQPSQQDEIMAEEAGQRRQLPASSRSEARGLSQGQIVRKRFLGHTGAIVGLAVFAIIFVMAFTSVGYAGIPGWWKYTHEDVSPLVNDGAPDCIAVAAGLGRAPLRPGPDRPRPVRHDHARRPAVHHHHGRDRPDRRPDRRGGRCAVRLLPRLDRGRPDAPHRRHHHHPALLLAAVMAPAGRPPR